MNGRGAAAGKTGCLNHELTLHCDGYLPVDETNIPTRTVDMPTGGMDFGAGKVSHTTHVAHTLVGGTHVYGRRGPTHMCEQHTPV